MTYKEILDYVKKEIPNISNKDLKRIAYEYIYENRNLDLLIAIHKREMQVRKWVLSKNKYYYRVKMLNGGWKIVYMCPEMVEDFYKCHGHREYELIG